MTAGLDQQQPRVGAIGVGDLGCAVAAGGGQFGQAGQGIKLGHQAGGRAHRRGLLAHPRSQLTEQLVLALSRTGLELQDLAFALLERRGDEALFVGQGLAADPVVGHLARLGPAHRQEVAKGAVVLQFQGADAAGTALGGFLLGQPAVLVVELVAQPIEQGVDAVMNQAALGQGQRWGVEQHVAQLGRQGFQRRPGPGQGLQRIAAALLQQARQLGQPLQAIGQGHQVPGRGGAGATAPRQPLQIAHGPQQPANGAAQGACTNQFAHGRLPTQDRGPLHQGRLDPTPQAAAAHGGQGAVEGPQQGAMDAAPRLGAGQFEVAAGGRIQHQGIARVPGGRQIQGHPGLADGAVQVGHQPAGGPQGQGYLPQPQAIEAGQAKALLERGGGFGRGKGGARLGGLVNARWTPAVGVAGAVAAFGSGLGLCPRHQQFSRLELQQLLVQLGAAAALAGPELAGADIGHRQAPAGALVHHRRQPVVAPGAQQALVDHGSGGQHPGDFAAQQLAFGGCGFDLIAQGDAVAAAHQLTAVALGGVVGDARHRHPADRLAPLLAGQGELEQPRHQDRVFKEAFKKVAQPVQQHPVGVGALELHVVAQHRRQLRGLHQVVVVPGRQVVVWAGVAVGFGNRWARGRRWLPGPGPGVGVRHQGRVMACKDLLVVLSLRRGLGRDRWL